MSDNDISVWCEEININFPFSLGGLAEELGRGDGHDMWIFRGANAATAHRDPLRAAGPTHREQLSDGVVGGPLLISLLIRRYQCIYWPGCLTLIITESFY